MYGFETMFYFEYIDKFTLGEGIFKKGVRFLGCA